LTDATVIEIGRDTLGTILLLMAPPLFVALLIGVAISVIQAATQIQEMTLSMVPKIIAVFMALAAFGPWMSTLFLTFAHRLLGGFPELVR